MAFFQKEEEEEEGHTCSKSSLSNELVPDFIEAMQSFCKNPGSACNID